MGLRVRNLRKLFDQKRGLLPTSFDVKKGELVSVVGHNGAGKTTLLKILANWILPDSGHVMVDGIDLKNRTAVVKNVGFVPEEAVFYDHFSVEYNLQLVAFLFRIPFLRVDEVLNEFNLIPFRKNRIHELSKGLKQRVNIGRALLTDPSVLLFDEPTSGLDFDMTKDVYRLLNTLHDAGKTILFTSHRPEEIKSLATRIMVLHEGRLIFDGTPLAYFQSDVHESLYA